MQPDVLTIAPRWLVPVAILVTLPARQVGKMYEPPEPPAPKRSSRAIEHNGTIYNSIRQAARASVWSTATLRKLAEDNARGWRWVE